MILDNDVGTLGFKRLLTDQFTVDRADMGCEIKGIVLSEFYESCCGH